MQPVTELILPTLPVETLEFSANPYPYLEAARRQHPWLARFSQGYVVHGYKATQELLGDDAHLISDNSGIVDYYGEHGTMWGRYMEEMMLARSGAEHTRLRSSVAKAFMPRHASQLRPLMQEVITKLLDEWAPKGEFDFADFAAFFPVTVMCGILGLSAEPITRLRSALDSQLTPYSLDLAAKPVFMAGFDVLWSFVDGLIDECEASGKHVENSLLDTLIAAKDAGGIDATELRFMLILILVGGYDTSKNMLTLTMLLLLGRPEIYARCAEDKDYCGKVMQEALRHSGIAPPRRVVARDLAYQGVEFRAGEVLVFATPLAGRDAEMFADPTTFDPEREKSGRHLAFGCGEHICPGQFIAKAQLQEGLHLIAQRLRNPRLNGEVAWRPFLGVWGLRTLPITFTPA